MYGKTKTFWHEKTYFAAEEFFYLSTTVV